MFSGVILGGCSLVDAFGSASPSIDAPPIDSPFLDAPADAPIDVAPVVDARPNVSSLTLDGATQFAFTTSTALNVDLPVTYEAWAFAVSTTGAQRIVVSERLSSNDYTALQIQISASGTWRCVFTHNTSEQVDLDTAEVALPSTWTHVALVLSATQQNCYVNGALTAQRNQALIHTTTVNAGFEIGAGFQGSSNAAFFEGAIDEVRVWSTGRSTVDIATTMTTTLTGTEPDLIAYWTLDDSLADRTSNGIDLVAGGTPGFSANVPF